MSDFKCLLQFNFIHKSIGGKIETYSEIITSFKNKNFKLKESN